MGFKPKLMLALSVLALPALKGFVQELWSSNETGNRRNTTDDTFFSNSTTCPNPAYQSKINEYNNMYYNSLRDGENNFGMPEGGNANYKSESKSIINKILSTPYNLWGSISNFVGGASKSANQTAIASYSNVDTCPGENGYFNEKQFPPTAINDLTSKQQGTSSYFVKLKRLNKELPPLAYPNGVPRVF